MPRKTKTRTQRKKRKAPPPGDVALVVGMTEDRSGYHIMRRRSEQHPVEFGTVRPLQEGKPIMGGGQVISLQPRKDFPFLHDVKVEVDTEPSEDARALEYRTGVGPALVANDDYRRGWDQVFGSDRTRKNAGLN